MYVRLLRNWVIRAGMLAERLMRSMPSLEPMWDAKSVTAHWIEGGKAPDARFRSAPMQVVRSEDGKTTFGAPNGVNGPTSLKFDDNIIELLIATGFVEVLRLAKEGHDGKIFINFLNKVHLPLIYIMYGAVRSPGLTA